jgi:hypothetical protein
LHSHKPLSAIKLLKDNNKNLEHLFGGIGVIGWMDEKYGVAYFQRRSSIFG